MLNKLKSLFTDTSRAAASGVSEDQLAIAVLLFEAAASDGVIEDSERSRIEALLSKHFELDAAAVKTLCMEALQTQRDAVELSRFTRAIKDHFEFDERISVIEMLWDVVYADGHVDDYEANLMRRVGGLIYVDDKANGQARKRAEAKRKQ